MVNVALGSISFYLVTKKIITARYENIGWWVGWWSYVDAIALTLNAYMGTDYFWSYHQTGIIGDTAINLGLIAFLLYFWWDNWALDDTDWAKIREIRKLAKVREISK